MALLQQPLPGLNYPFVGKPPEGNVPAPHAATRRGDLPFLDIIKTGIGDLFRAGIGRLTNQITPQHRDDILRAQFEALETRRAAAKQQRKRERLLSSQNMGNLIKIGGVVLLVGGGLLMFNTLGRGRR